MLQEAPGNRRRPQEPQEVPGGPRKFQEAPGSPRKPQETSGIPRKPQETPEGPMRIDSLVLLGLIHTQTHAQLDSLPGCQLSSSFIFEVSCA